MCIVEWEDFIRRDAPPFSARNPPSGPDSGGKLAAAIGVFDGVHRGHLALIERIRVLGIPVVITFRENPKSVLSPSSFKGDLYSLRQKLSVFGECGVSVTVLIDFSENFSKMQGRDFIGLLENRRDLAFLAVGANFRCGHRLDTGAAALRSMTEKAGVKTEIVQPVMEGRRPVSSSRIRDAVASGDLESAALLLGRPFGLDLSGLPSHAEGGRRIVDLRAFRGITPPPGSRRALVFTAEGGKGEEAAVSVENGRIVISLPREEKRGEIVERLLFI
ncbi:MAG: FAD synthetase family protein [Treponema sp.]|jgi:riboflavin kinase/FMN adenylyltransferase|nr:FAD synthetase family protein [Treponema sp.]